MNSNPKPEKHQSFFFMLLVVITLVGVIYSQRFALLSAFYGLHSTGKTEVNILFLGSPYISKIPYELELLSYISSDFNYILKTQSVIINASSMKEHWENKKSLDLVKSKKWDFVVIQGPTASQTIGNGFLIFDQYGGRFINEIKRTGAQPILFTLWPREKSEPLYSQTGLTYDQLAFAMNNQLFTTASKMKSDIIYTSPSFDAASASGLLLYKKDKRQANALGNFLAASVLYKRLYPDTTLNCEKIIFSRVSKKDCEQIVGLIRYNNDNK